MTKKKLALVLGATGGIGGTVARTLLARGWRVRAMGRDAVGAAKKLPAYEWVQGDAMNAADVLAAAQGAEVIVHAVNPPGYKDWETLVVPMLDNTIAAAKAVGARIVFPGTVYNFGPNAFPTLRETSPQNPKSKKGALRVEMERRLEAVSSDVQVIIVRCGDYFGPNAASNWFSAAMVKPGQKVSTIRNPGYRGVGHQWAYLPDVAETMVRLLERASELPAFAVYHMDGFFDADGTELAAAIARVAGNGAKVKPFMWWIVPIAAPFVTFMREVKEMRYLWRESLRMSNDRLLSALGEEPHTPIDEAVRTTLASLGCI
ncbi:MAG TPA: NAD-dependent epimerase/dehydratase family protein [Kofleriaceae bacterium]|jgi:nucleoside-diphosphate-sugar epimerase